jgi:SPP1 family phage portal protein
MIQTTEQITSAIQTENEQLISMMLKDLVQEHRAGEGERQKKLWNRYLQKDVPIHRRKPASYEKVDRRTAADFFGDIVDIKTGYMGNEVTIELDKENYKNSAGDVRETVFARDVDVLREFARDNDSLDLNSEAVRYACICGVSYRLLYVPDGENRVAIKNLKPWEVIYIYDRSIDEPQVVLRYYAVKEKEWGREGVKEITFVEWYDREEIVFYRDNGNMDFSLDLSQGQEGRLPNLFIGIPIIPMANNEQRFAEPEKALDIMDAYDAIISSTTSEIEQLRLAYMYAKGAGLVIDDTLMYQLEQTGIFPLPENGEMGFINKELAVQAVTGFLNKLEELIYKFSKSVNLSRDYGGDMRVIGWQIVLLPVENSCIVTERKFKKALRLQYKLVTEYWRTFTGVDIGYNSLDFTFTRNMPKDLLGEAEILEKLMGHISKKTALSLMSFIEDPDKELRAIEEERSMYPDVEVDNGGFGQADEDGKPADT